MATVSDMIGGETSSVRFFILYTNVRFWIFDTAVRVWILHASVPCWILDTLILDFVHVSYFGFPTLQSDLGI